jgi:hypothetical protein
MVVIGTHFRTLNLNKLKNVENGIIHLHTEQLCLYETIDWSSIVGDQTSFAISDKNQEYTRSQQCGNKLLNTWHYFSKFFHSNRGIYRQ